MPRSKGSALLGALFVVSIMAMLSIAVLRYTAHLLQIANLAEHTQQRLRVLEGTTLWGLTIIKQHTHSDAKPVIHFMPADEQLGPLQFRNVTLQATLSDPMGRFNINMLKDPSQIPRFVRLCQSVTSDYSTQQLNAIGQRISRHIRAQSNSMTSDQGLLRVNGLVNIVAIPKPLYTRIAPFLTALPNADDTINLNTTSQPVLFATQAALNPMQAKQIMTCIQSAGPFATLAAFKTACILPSGLNDLTDAQIGSQYALLHGDAASGTPPSDQHNQLTTLLTLKTIDQHPQVIALWQVIT